MESLQASGKRYQNTYRGRLNHAERQRRYLDHKKNKVTHHGSFKTIDDDLLQPEVFEVNEYVDSAHDNKIRCSFCCCECDSSLRIAFLTQNRSSIPGVWPLGP